LGIWLQAAVFGVVTPEIDPTSCASAITLLAGVIIVIHGRRK
jgi:hypothetical protein